MKNWLVVALMMCVSCTAMAENNFGFLLGGGLTFGGDEIASFDVQYDDGDNGSEDLNAGELIHLYAGLLIRHNAADGVKYGAQLDVGYLFDGLFAENGDATFSRIPMEVIGTIEYKWLRIGAGITRHTNVELDVDLEYGGSGSVDFQDATGMVFLAEYLINQSFSFGLRYVNIEYELANDPWNLSENIDGSHVGITANILF